MKLSPVNVIAIIVTLTICRYGYIVSPMTVERSLRLIAGLVILASLALGAWVSPWFFLLTAFVGLNLLQSGFTDWCPMMVVLRKAGLSGATCSSSPGRGTKA